MPINASEDVPISLPVKGKIALVISHSDGYDLCLLDIPTLSLVRVAQAENTVGTSLKIEIEWSPDGTQFLLQQMGVGGWNASSAFKADGSARSRFATYYGTTFDFPRPGDYSLSECHWSPDGQYIGCFGQKSRLTPYWYVDVYDDVSWSLICRAEKGKKNDCLPLPLASDQWWHYGGPDIGWQLSDLRESVLLSSPPTPTPAIKAGNTDAKQSPDRRYLAWIDRDGKLYIFDAEDSVVKAYQTKGHIVGLAWSPLP